MKGIYMEDQIAISRLKQGDLNGLETLVNRYQVRAVQAAYMIVLERGLAEDVVQEAFIKVADRIHQFKDGRPFAPWFFRVVTNDALKVVKKQKRKVSLENPNNSVRQIAEWLTDPAPQPEIQLEKKEIRQNIMKAIQSLPPEQRTVIVMQHFLNMSEKDMAAKMERPLSTIKWWLRDARKRLRNLLDSSR